MFVIARSATWLALRRRTGTQYLRERLLRLTIPLLFGLVVIVPPQAFMAYLERGNGASYPEFFVQCGLNPFSYIFLVIAGFVLIGDERFQFVLNHSWCRALGLGVCTLAALVAIRFSGIKFPESSWQSSVRDFLLYFTIWALVIGLLGFGHCFLNRPGRVLSYLGPASYPYYLLHQTVIVFIGFYVVHWGIGILPKFLIIGIVAVGVTLGLYELARRLSVTRFLMGIKTVTI